MGEALLAVDHLFKSYPGLAAPVLNGVSFEMAQGETLALTGESGSGKSTLLHLIAGLEAADGGCIQIGTHEITALDDAARARLRRRQIGIVFQQFNLIASLDIQANIGFQARLSGRGDPDLITRLASVLGLTEHLSKFPEQLSGGQQQRVAIARVLAARPALILADEPTGNLDEATAETVLAELLELTRETNAALLMVTHSSRIAARLSSRLHLRHGRLA